MVGFLPITGQNTEGSQRFERLRNISESWGISQRVGEGFRGSEECFGGFYKARKGLKNFGGAREETEKDQRGWEGTEKVRGAILQGAVRKHSLGLGG